MATDSTTPDNDRKRDDETEAAETTDTTTETSPETSAEATDQPGDQAAAEPDPHPINDHATTEVEEVVEESHGGSFAGRLLTWLILLIAGAGLGIWGGPRLAPHLPSGMAPVAEWLTPGASSVREEIAAVRASVDANSADIAATREAIQTEIAALPDAAELTAPIDERVSALEVTASQMGEGLADRLGAVEGQVGTLTDTLSSANPGDLAGQISALQARVDGLAAEYTALQDQLTGIAATGEGATELSEQAAAQLATFAAAVEGLKAELSGVASQNGELRQRIDEVSAAADRQAADAAEEIAAARDQAAADVAAAAEAAEAAEAEATIRASLAAVDAAIESGAAFDGQLAELASAAGIEAPTALAAVAEGGVATLPNLRARFSDAAHDAIRETITADADDSAASRLGAFLRSQVATRSLTPREGDDPDAVLSRAEAALQGDDLAGALAEIAVLPDAARAAMGAWLSDATNRQAAITALGDLRAQIAATN